MSKRPHLLHVAKGLGMHKKRLELNPREDQAVFCNRCITMTMDLLGLQCLKSISGYKHHNRPELAAHARRGCPFCFWIYSELSHVWEQDSPGRVYIFATTPMPQATNIEEWNYSRIQAKVLLESTASGGSSLPTVWFKVSGRLQLFKTEHALRECLVTTQTRSTDMASSEAMRRALKQLEHCQKNHAQCSKEHESMLPTRVINVGSQEDRAIKIHLTQEGERGQYLTLSYCWGKLPQYITTKETIKDESRTIQLDNLAQTIKDAVSITRQLGFQYLWIDALCIVQDCPTDKSNEISRMHEVYKNSTLTISASTAFGVMEGFLYNIPAERSFQLPIRMRNGTVGFIDQTAN